MIWNSEKYPYKWDQPNPSQQEGAKKMGLTIIDLLERSNECYEFDTVIVWKHENGNVYWAEDKGCSCPTPFEFYVIGDGVKLLEKEYLPEFADKMMKERDCAPMEAVLGFMESVRGAFK